MRIVLRRIGLDSAAFPLGRLCNLAYHKAMDDLDQEIQAAVASAAEELEADEQARRGEHFIPLRKADLVEMLSQRQFLSKESEEQFRRLCRHVETALHGT